MMDTQMGGYGHSHYPQSTAASDRSLHAPSSHPTQPFLPPPSSLQHPSPRPPLEILAPTRSPVSFGGPDTRYHPYGPNSQSPNSVSGSMPEPGDQYGTSGLSPTHPTGPSQKRAYRQRRKDPSCDACRERKVKCDATETSSCSECSSRSVKCQFTKETNRRMSSIKQVQDLQQQLSEAKQQINQLRGMLDGAHQEGSRSRQAPTHPSSLDSRRRRERSPAIQGFDHARRNLRKYSRGVFKLPPPHRTSMLTPLINSTEPALPPVDVVEALLQIYHDQVQRQSPMIHWPTFIQQWESVREAGNFIGAPQIWVALFFAVLACGSLQPISPPEEITQGGMRYIVVAARLLNTWTDNLLADHARTALLISIFLYEANVRSAGWVWLGTAVRMSQEVGLQYEDGPWSPVELEGRLRTYWSIISWDRLLSIQENKPLQVDLAEDEAWPLGVDEESILSRSKNPRGFRANSAVIPAIKLIGSVKKTLSMRVLSRETLQQYDDSFRAIQQEIPEHLQPHSDSSLEPFVFSSLIPLLTLRFQLHRHNINAYATPQERALAVDRCYSVAYDTVRYLLRIMRNPPATAYRAPLTHQQTWQQMLDAIAHNLPCRHVWRCTLLLCLKGDYSAASTCVQFSKAIGKARKMNIACGRYLAFFLDCLIDAISRGKPQQLIEEDLELLAYATGDLQGDLEGGFVWTGVSAAAPPKQDHSDLAPQSAPPFEEEEAPASALLTEKEMSDWGGWERIERQISHLYEEQTRRRERELRSPFQPARARAPTQSQSYYHRPAHNDGKRVQLAQLAQHRDDSLPPEEQTPSTSGASVATAVSLGSSAISNVTATATATAGSGAGPTAGATAGPGGGANREPPAGASRISIANII